MHALGRGVGISKVALGSESYTRFPNFKIWCSSRIRELPCFFFKFRVWGSKGGFRPFQVAPCICLSRL